VSLSHIDAFIVAVRETFRTAQSAFFWDHLRYWQGGESHSVPPEKPTIADRLDEKTDPSGITWREFVPTLARIPVGFSVRVDQYEAKTGHGYIVTYTTPTAFKIDDFGPGGFARDWTDSIPAIRPG